MNKTNVAIGVLAGVAVGALLGVLFAPDKGSETRKKLSRKATDKADEVKDKFDELLEEFTEKFEAAKAEASQMYERGRRKVEEFRKDGKLEDGDMDARDGHPGFLVQLNWKNQFAKFIKNGGFLNENYKKNNKEI